MRAREATLVIPARWGSERLPGKIMADIGGRPVLWHTWSRACGVSGVKEVVVAVDDERILREVESWGARVVMTDPVLRCGTARIASILDLLKGDFIINVQADSCFIEKAVLDLIIECYRGEAILTPVYRIESEEVLRNPNLVKVVLDGNGHALYFSRQAIPYVRGVVFSEWLSMHEYWGHMGVYAYERGVLEAYKDLSEGVLERVEKLEQLCFLEAGYRIKTVEVEAPVVEVDTEADLEKARNRESIEV